MKKIYSISLVFLFFLSFSAFAGNNFPYALTSQQYASSAVSDATCQAEFGASSKMVDWLDIQQYVTENSLDAFFSELDLQPFGAPGWREDAAMVTYNGNQIQSGNRHYFIARHDGNRPGHFAVHQTIDNRQLDLGSWAVTTHVLCTKGDAPEENFPYVKTVQQYASDSVSDATCQAEFGASSKMVDWLDIQQYVTENSLDAFFSGLDLLPFGAPGWREDAAMVTYNGDQIQSGNRHYFISRHDGNILPHFLVHQTIDNRQLDLGSWAVTTHVLCTKGDAPEEDFPYVKTVQQYASDSVSDATCQTEFGYGSKMVDWLDIQQYVTENSLDAFFSGLDLLPFGAPGWREDAAMVTYNGNQIQSGNRHYFISRHDGNILPHFLVHQTIDNRQLDLGSWSVTAHVLCTKSRFPYALTSQQYASSAVSNATCQAEFGVNSKMVDWLNIQQYVTENSLDAFFLGLDLLPFGASGWREDAAMVTYNGNQIQSGTRHYFIARHDGNRPGHFGVHQTIDNHQLDLGSWAVTTRALCSK